MYGYYIIFYSDSQQFIPKSALTFKICEIIPKCANDYLVHYKNLFLEKQNEWKLIVCSQKNFIYMQKLRLPITR